MTQFMADEPGHLLHIALEQDGIDGARQQDDHSPAPNLDGESVPDVLLHDVSVRADHLQPLTGGFDDAE